MDPDTEKRLFSQHSRFGGTSIICTDDIDTMEDHIG